MIPVFHFKKLRNNYGILCEPISGEFILIVNFSASVDKVDFTSCPSLKKEAALQTVHGLDVPDVVKAEYRKIIEEGWE